MKKFARITFLFALLFSALAAPGVFASDDNSNDNGNDNSDDTEYVVVEVIDGIEVLVPVEWDDYEDLEIEISAEDALKAARAIYPTFEVEKIELTEDDDQYVWDIEFEGGREVEVSTDDGDIIDWGYEHETDSEDDVPGGPDDNSNDNGSDDDNSNDNDSDDDNDNGSDDDNSNDNSNDNSSDDDNSNDNDD
ncbi:MAG: PepSY domain-containing protein [Anaerolineae bacterium]|nr:PepSY domain-containing protein [Anaerolineae bacterium]